MGEWTEWTSWSLAGRFGESAIGRDELLLTRKKSLGNNTGRRNKKRMSGSSSLPVLQYRQGLIDDFLDRPKAAYTFVAAR